MTADSTCFAYLGIVDGTSSLCSRKRTHIFRVVGQFVAKAMLDSRIIDLHLNKVFLKLVLGEEVALTLDNLRVCPNLTLHLTKLKAFVSALTPSSRNHCSNYGT